MLAWHVLKKNDIAYCVIATDGSNHDELKLFPVIIQYFDRKNGDLRAITLTRESRGYLWYRARTFFGSLDNF